MAHKGLRKTENVMPWGWLAAFMPIAFVWGYYDTKEDVNLLAEGQRMLYANQIEIMRDLEEQRRVAPRGPAIEIVPPPQAEPAAIRPEAPARTPTQTAKLKIVQTDARIPHKSIDVFCMAKNIFHEAGVEDRMGKYAVAQVTLNRMANPKYPTTVCDVVMDPFQFSWANDRKIRWTRPKGAAWNESVRIAEKVLIKGYRVQGLEQANYYHADYVAPRWRKPEAKIAKVGTHIFYASAR
jgi:spore germination cell wall hydrolase CwlJ-like protein